uniref:Lipocalin/cytosolic fatty-acid binding domain-containing protein n=2 Tax=Trichogramma kaykai TaxID=54128 RepID=A0ABD2XJA4_9HYME
MYWKSTIRLLCLVGLASAIAEDAYVNQCSELKAQEHLDLNEMMGKWYVVEVIEHRREASWASPTLPSGAQQHFVIDACPIVHLRALETRGGRQQAGPPRISLLWDEAAGNLEYTFWVSQNRGPGVWNSDIIQNGTLTHKSTYKQFVGTVHVMKAVASHMVVTFCTRGGEGHMFSLLLGREHRLPKNDLRGIRKLLERRNLQLLVTRESCHNTAAIVASSTSILQLLLFSILPVLGYNRYFVE